MPNFLVKFTKAVPATDRREAWNKALELARALDMVAFSVSYETLKELPADLLEKEKTK